MVSGVYIIKSVVNGKFYIGSSNGVSRRWRDHKAMLLRNGHPNAKLQNHFNKYGKACFLFEVIEECAPELLIHREQHWISLLSPPLNICTVANRTTGITYKLSKATRQRMSNAQKGKKRGYKVTIHRQGDNVQSKQIVRTANDGSVKKYPSLSSVKNDGFTFQNVYRAIKNKWNHRGYRWEYSTKRG